MNVFKLNVELRVVETRVAALRCAAEMAYKTGGITLVQIHEINHELKEVFSDIR